MRLTTRRVSQCLIFRLYLWRRPALSRQALSVRLLTPPGCGPVARSRAILGRMPRPGPRMHSRVTALHKDSPSRQGPVTSFFPVDEHNSSHVEMQP